MAENKPKWLKATYNQQAANKMQSLLTELNLNTVCDAASCPNAGECYSKDTATFLIMGNNCTRSCRFCAVAKEKPTPLNPAEPENVAIAAQRLGLKHVVVTSVTRDDLADGGAAHYAATILALRQALPAATVEVLIPDLKGVKEHLAKIIAAAPDVINHNLETVPSLYREVRPEADYKRSLQVLKQVKEAGIISKTGLMLGLGETEAQVLAVMDDVLAADCDILTLGQYLRPSPQHLPVKEFIPPEKFAQYKITGEKKGLKYIASSPLVRSSYNALAAVEKVKGG